MRVARSLEIPIMATAEDVELDGPLVPELADLMPADSPPIPIRWCSVFTGKTIRGRPPTPLDEVTSYWSGSKPMFAWRSPH